MENIIRLVDEKTDLSNLKPYNWDLVIKSRPYFVAKIEGYVHSIGGHWGINNLWCWPRNETPTYDNIMGFSGMPCRWGYRVENTHYIRTKHDVEVYQKYEVIITRNDVDFFSFWCTDIGAASAKAITTICELSDHPAWLNEIDFDKKLIGRKVFYRESPAIIKSWVYGQACVILEPDYNFIHYFPKPACYQEDDPWFTDEENTIKADILDKHIYWFRG